MQAMRLGIPVEPGCHNVDATNERAGMAKTMGRHESRNRREKTEKEKKSTKKTCHVIHVKNVIFLCSNYQKKQGKG